MTDSAPSASSRTAIPRTVWMLGFVSLLMDVSSEMIHGLLPVFMVTVLGSSATAVGAVEGVAEATALIVKIFSGAASDWLGRRKLLAALGYGLGACTKPLFALASGVGWIFAARFVDRIGKGIRGAPRDALIADVTPPAIRGAAFGLRQSLDTIGAFLGPLLAMALMLLWANDFRAVFWVAVLPAFLSVALLVAGVEEPAPAAVEKRGFPLSRAALARLPAAYWAVVAAGAVLTLARFSEAFLVLRGQQAGLSPALAPLVLIVMNVVYAGLAYPLGRLADAMPRDTLLALGILPLLAADLALAADGGLPMAGLGIVLWGVHMAATQGLLAAMVADTVPADLRGTGYGMFNLVSGIAMLAASLVAGVLWDRAGAPATFLAGAAFALLSLLLFFLRRRPAIRG